MSSLAIQIAVGELVRMKLRGPNYVNAVVIGYHPDMPYPWGVVDDNGDEKAFNAQRIDNGHVVRLGMCTREELLTHHHPKVRALVNILKFDT